MDFNKFFQSKLFKGILLGIGVFIVFLLIFKLGMFVGFKKANFSFRWGENYHRNFAGPKGGFFQEFEGRDFIDAHGVFGQIIKIDDSTLVIKGNDDVEKIVLVKDDTTIMSLREKIKVSDLKINDNIVVVGDPNDSGQIEAKLIRITPPLPPGGPMMPMRPIDFL